MITCPSCGAGQPDTALFCSRCGAGLRAAASPAAAESIPAEPKTSTLAVVALILSLIPLCVWIVGLVLGIVALVRINERPQELKGKGLAIAAIVVPVVWFFVGILAAIAIPNFIRFQARAKQAEAKTNLRALYVAERSYEAEHPGQRAPSMDALGFALDPRRRYAYFYGTDARQPDLGGPYALDAATRGQLSGDELGIAVANLDSDRTLDVWTIDARGELRHLVDDVGR